MAWLLSFWSACRRCRKQERPVRQAARCSRLVPMLKSNTLVLCCRSPPGTAGQQDRGKSAGPGFPDLDGSGRTGGGAPPDHAGPQADVAGLPDPDAGPRPDAAGRGAGRRTTSPDPGRIPAGTAGPGRVLGQGRAAPRTVVLGGVGGIHPSLLAGSRVRGGGGSPAAGGTTVARARRGFREELLNAPCSRLSIVRFDTGPKRSMGHLLGGEKNNFFNSRY